MRIIAWAIKKIPPTPPPAARPPAARPPVLTRIAAVIGVRISLKTALDSEDKARASPESLKIRPVPFMCEENQIRPQ